MVIFEFLIIFIFFSGLLIFCSKFKHLLVILLGLEFVVLSIFLGIFFYYGYFSYDYFLILVYLVISVSEGALSLGMLVNLIRNHGRDYILSFSVLW